MYKTTWGFTSDPEQARKDYGSLWGVVSYAPTGEIKPGRSVWNYQDALRKLRNADTGEEMTEIVSDYYQSLKEGLEPSDYCFYCGADNGPNGESRIGWDCYNCGGN